MKSKNRQSKVQEIVKSDAGGEQLEKESDKGEKKFVPRSLAEQLRWFFRTKESKQKGVLGILQVKELLMSIISQIYSDEDECEDCIEQVMKGYNLDLYEEANMMVSEEEFVYDSMRNHMLILVMAAYNKEKSENIL